MGLLTSLVKNGKITPSLRPSLYVALQSNLIQAIKFDDSAMSKTN